MAQSYPLTEYTGNPEITCACIYRVLEKSIRKRTTRMHAV